MPSNTTIVEILWRYKKREELSDGEIVTLQSWLRESTDHEKLFEELSNHAKWEAEIDKWQSKDPDSTWNRIRKSVEALSPDTFAEKKSRVWIRYISAAACIGIISFIFWWFNTRGTVKEKIVTPSANHEIMPSTNTATLTLGNGSVIQLDSLRPGTVAKQGSTNILKTDSAALNYNVSVNNSKEVFYNTLSTPKGSQYNLVLPDGSRIWLNALTTLRFPVSFNGATRKVELNGEAYFEVAKDKSKPFIVQSSHSISVRVLGTHFNVNAYSNEPVSKVDLFEGSVIAGSEKDSVIIKPGQEARLYETEKFTVTAANLEQTTAWRNKMFWYQNASFDEIMRQLSRWYDINVVYTGRVNQSYTGILPTGLPMSNVLKILEKSGNVHFTIGEGNKVIVSP
jgi:transmembrane sensor